MNSHVGDVLQTNLKEYSQKTYNTLKPLSRLLDIFVINNNIGYIAYSECFYISKCFLAITFFGSLDLYGLYYRYRYIYERVKFTHSVKLTETLQMIHDLIQYIFDLWFVYKYGRHITFKYFKRYERLDKILGMTSYPKIKWRVIRLISFFTVLWLLTSLCDYVVWSLNYGLRAPSLYSIAYFFFYAKILTTLDLSTHVMHIESRLVAIAEIVQKYYSTTEPLPGFIGDYKKSWLEMPSKSSQTTQCVSTLESADVCPKLTFLTRCYLLLTEQVEFINRIFGVRILLNSLSLLIDIIRFTNASIRTVLGSLVVANDTLYFPAAPSIMRQICCCLVVISLVYHCEKVYHQRVKIISTIDRLLINKNPNDKLRATMEELREIMQARPISFNMANFFRLDNSLLISITSTVVTYTIILLQSMN